MVSDAQVRKLMRERSKGATVEVAALKAGMTRRTGSKYLKTGKLPSAMKSARTWRTRSDPFEMDWPVVEVMLEDAPELEAKSLFEWLLDSTGRYEPGQVRTFQRRVRLWRALHGPDKEVFFPQQHRRGEAAQTDFTWATELGITIGGVLFEHKLCHLVLPYSNWSWATVCRSESLPALRHGVQEALFRLGKRPVWHQTDNSTAATHDVPSGKREFNDNYVKLMDHLGMKPRTIGIGKSNQNGDVEAMNGVLKRRLKQHLLLRGSFDFESVEAYEAWLAEVLTKANARRTERLKEELAVMEPLTVVRLPAYTEIRVDVTSWSTIRVKFNTYSVPSRLIGEKVQVRVYDDRIEAYFAGVRQLVTDRLQGRKHLLANRARAQGKRVDLVVGNPPFKHAISHVEAGRECFRKAVQNFILPLAYLGVGEWQPTWDRYGLAELQPIAGRPWPERMRETATYTWEPLKPEFRGNRLRLPALEWR